MAKLSQAEAEQAVLDAVRTAGDSITHNALIEKLEANNKGMAVMHISRLAAQGKIVASVDAQPTGKAVLSYRIGV